MAALIKNNHTVYVPSLNKNLLCRGKKNYTNSISKEVFLHIFFASETSNKKALSNQPLNYTG